MFEITAERIIHADLETWEVDYRRPTLSPRDQVLQQLAEQLQGFVPAWSAHLFGVSTERGGAWLQQLAGPSLRAMQELSSLNGPAHLYMRCSECPESPL